MPSRKQALKDSIKQLSEKERKEALEWIDSLSEKELKKFEQLTKIQLTQFLIEKYINDRILDSKKSSRKK